LINFSRAGSERGDSGYGTPVTDSHNAAGSVPALPSHLSLPVPLLVASRKLSSCRPSFPELPNKASSPLGPGLIGSAVVADDLRIVAGSARDGVIASSATDYGSFVEPDVVSDEKGIVPGAANDCVVAAGAGDGLVRGAFAKDHVRPVAALDLVIATGAADDGHKHPLTVTEDGVVSATTLDRLVAAAACDLAGTHAKVIAGDLVTNDALLELVAAGLAGITHAFESSDFVELGPDALIVHKRRFD
jgi:hypothetical protein